jgi:sugar phosphate isomerase/epimerase
MITPLSMTTDFAADRGDPSPALRRIAAAGFTHVHWCHQWNTDFLYAAGEIRQIGAWLGECGLRLLDLHGSAGVEKVWTSPHEYARQAGVELVRNRIEMTAALGGGAVVMHTGGPGAGGPAPFWSALRRSLDELRPAAAAAGVRLAIENGDWSILRTLLAEYPPEYLGVCYDCGHGNLAPGSLEQIEAVRDRLVAVHLHDNDGHKDLHNLFYTGTVPWPRLAAILARSAYRKPLNLEVNMRNGSTRDEAAFLAQAQADGLRLVAMVREAAGGP